MDPVAHLDVFADAWLAFPHVADVIGHLTAMSKHRKNPTPDEIRLLLEGCGFVEEPTQTPSTYVGRDLPTD